MPVLKKRSSVSSALSPLAAAEKPSRIAISLAAVLVIVFFLYFSNEMPLTRTLTTGRTPVMDSTATAMASWAFLQVPVMFSP